MPKGREREAHRRRAEKQKARQRAGGGDILEAIRGGSPAHHKALLNFIKGMVVHAHVPWTCCHHLHYKIEFLMQQKFLPSAFGLFV